MPPYMLPKNIEIWEDLPCNTDGKIDRAGIKMTIYKKLSIEEAKIPKIATPIAETVFPATKR